MDKHADKEVTTKKVSDKVNKFLQSTALKVAVSAKAFVKVFYNPGYILLVVVGALLSASLVIWSLNLDLARYILLELDGVSMATRLQTIFWDPYISIFTTLESFQALGIVMFSTLFGFNTAILVYVLKNQGLSNIPKKSSFGGTVSAVLAGGCVACGTSVLAPLMATFGATSGVFLRDLSTWLNWAASILIIYSIYKLGLLAATVQAKRKLKIDY